MQQTLKSPRNGFTFDSGWCNFVGASTTSGYEAYFPSFLLTCQSPVSGCGVIPSVIASAKALIMSARKGCTCPKDCRLVLCARCKLFILAIRTDKRSQQGHDLISHGYLVPVSLQGKKSDCAHLTEAP